MGWLDRFRRPRGAADCRQVGRFLQSYLDGEVDALTGDEIRAHLDECGDCGLEAQSFRELKAAIVRQTVPDADSRARLREFAERLASGEMDSGVDPTGA